MKYEPIDNCDEYSDTYRSVCRKLSKLCPRLVPSPLWGLNLASIARIAPESAIAICDDCSSLVELVSRYWLSLDRSGKCEVCGGKGNEIDEDWLYCVFDRNNRSVDYEAREVFHAEEAANYKGIACLKRIRLLCDKCHLAKHQGYALVHGRKQEAIEHLANVNKISMNETVKLVSKAFSIHNELSKIRDWTIKLCKLEGLDEEQIRRIETFLNTMYRRGFFLSGGWLYYRSPIYYSEVEPRVISEVLQLLVEAVKNSGTNNVRENSWINSLLDIIKRELEARGIAVLEREFQLFIDYILGDERKKRVLQRLVDDVVKNRFDIQRLNTISLAFDVLDLTGKWMVFVPTKLYPRVFRYMIEALEKEKLSYSAKIIARRKDYTSREDMPIIIYVPVSIAPKHIADVAEIMRRILDEFYIDKRMYFKPDIFTEKGVYSRTTAYKSYIYVFQS